MKGGVEVKSHSFLTQALGRDVSLASHHGRINLEKKIHQYWESLVTLPTEPAKAIGTDNLDAYNIIIHYVMELAIVVRCEKKQPIS